MAGFTKVVGLMTKDQATVCYSGPTGAHTRVTSRMGFATGMEL